MRHISILAAAGALLAGCAGSDDPWNGEFPLATVGDAGPEAAAGPGQPLGYNDRLYRAEDGHYYCARADGSPGRAVIEGGGALPAALIDEGGSAKLGELLGVAGGDVVRRALAQQALTCV
ncbi:MAG: hypothetical protein ACXWUP_06635 [Allosphingosinicella sp.]